MVLSILELCHPIQGELFRTEGMTVLHSKQLTRENISYTSGFEGERLGCFQFSILYNTLMNILIIIYFSELLQVDVWNFWLM